MADRSTATAKLTVILLGVALSAGMAPSAAAETAAAVPQDRNISLVHANTNSKALPHGGATHEGHMVLTWPHEHPGQAWELERTGYDGRNFVYAIRNERSDKCLEPQDRDTRDGAFLVQMNCSERRTQQWVIDPIPWRDAYHIAPSSRPYLGITLQYPEANASWLQLGHRHDSRSAFDWRLEER